jgi:NAD(P)-dependent dehydrogenase (short-subunit alcohol dehydrogenase family)
MPGRVANKVAIVVGGGQTPGETIGNGRATAVLLAREGARVVVADRRVDSAQDTVDMIAGEGNAAVACEVDVTVEDSVAALIRQVVERFGTVDILHNNVGASIALGDARADVMTVEAFDRSFAVNFKSAWLAAKHALPIMREHSAGSIVNISSLAAWEAYPLVGY